VIGFTELAGDAGTLADAIKNCTDNPCKLTAVEGFKSDYDRIALRGVFGVHPRLQQVGNILDGIIASARIYYGARPPQTTSAGPASPLNAEKDVKDGVKALKAAMAVK
jgi:Asp-tRNA(Asn)/Glu-tRNA(Gln) amidotransferase A subunit family amidase